MLRNRRDITKNKKRLNLSMFRKNQNISKRIEADCLHDVLLVKNNESK